MEMEFHDDKVDQSTLNNEELFERRNEQMERDEKNAQRNAEEDAHGLSALPQTGPADQQRADGIGGEAIQPADQRHRKVLAKK